LARERGVDRGGRERARNVLDGVELALAHLAKRRDGVLVAVGDRGVGVSDGGQVGPVAGEYVAQLAPSRRPDRLHGGARRTPRTPTTNTQKRPRHPRGRFIPARVPEHRLSGANS
jgi:hypothetical protein